MRVHIPLASAILALLALGLGSGCSSSGGATCSDLQARYADALPAALTCDVGGAGQCQQSVYEALSPCLGCMIYVNDAATLSTIKASWVQAGCDKVAVACPALSCVQPTSGQCVAGDGGGGSCRPLSAQSGN
jgi:hypothetical protein